MSDDVRISKTSESPNPHVTLVVPGPAGSKYFTPVFPHRGEFRAVLVGDQPVLICDAHQTSGNPPPCPVHPSAETI